MTGEIERIAAEVERLEGILATELGKPLLLEAWKLVAPAPSPTRVPRRANGEPWGGDGLGPYTEEYSRWSEQNAEFRRFIEVGAFLDAAMSLVPEGYAVGFKRAPCQRSHAMLATIGYEANASGATPALALCAAALRAHLEQHHAKD